MSRGKSRKALHILLWEVLALQLFMLLIKKPRFTYPIDIYIFLINMVLTRISRTKA